MVKFLKSPMRQFCDRAAKVKQPVDGQHPDTSTIGQDAKPATLEAPDINHCFRGSEQLPQIHDAKKAGAPKCGVIHVIDAGQCAGMRGGGLGRSFVPPDLRTMTGFTRAAARAAD